ncbi:MAG: hypothetical protein V7767_04055 [Leeuwenhoekiella sp.]
MYRLFAFILFLTFALRPIYQAGYIVYFQLNIDSIVEKYCVNKAKPELHCNGKCHLTQQLNLSQDDSGKNAGRILVPDSFIPLYFQVAQYEIPLVWMINNKSENWKRTFLQESRFSDIPYPPPKLRLYTFT